jgi:hypothetical protein
MITISQNISNFSSNSTALNGRSFKDYISLMPQQTGQNDVPLRKIPHSSLIAKVVSEETAPPLWLRQQAGNCVATATLQMLQNSHPKVLDNLIKPNGDKGYFVSLYHPDTSKTTKIAVTFKDLENFALEPSDSNASIVEVALNKLYKTIPGNPYGSGVRDGAHEPIIFSSIFGNKNTFHHFKEITPEKISKALKEKKIVVMSTDKTSDKKLFSNHAYGVLSIDTNKKTIRLYNPHGIITTVSYDSLKSFILMSVSPKL